MKHARLLTAGVVAAALAAIPLAVAIGARSAQPTADDIALIDGVIQLVEHDYVHPVSAHALTTDALKGMLTRLDPHSDYMDEQEYKESQSNISGRFGGLGIEISEQDGVPKVIAPIDGTPAERAGLQPGDLIVSIEGESTQGMSLDKVVRVLRGKPGTNVTITIARSGKQPFNVTITRAIIKVATVKFKLEPHDIGYARITEFGESTPEDLKHALKTMTKQAGRPLEGVVLDLRNNPGGLLTSAVAVVGDFVRGGTVVTIKGRLPSDNEVYRADAHYTLEPKVPMVVLINGASASASEIVSGALQDRHRATIMGTQSFGKGSVQTIIPLNGHGALRLTTALYYTPSGRSIQGKGITPNVILPAPKDEQISGAYLPHEASLAGAFHNPGSLKKPASKNSKTKSVPLVDEKFSPPIKANLIGTAKDAQLKAALTYIENKLGLQANKG